MTQEKLAEGHHVRPQWRSRMGFILAALGSAIGLGNIWRFSYLCYKNGGGAFLIPYLIALVTVGIPLLILELGIGHRMRGSAPLTFAKVDKHWEWLGWWSVNCAMYGIMLYYAAVIAWCLSYVFFSINLSWGADPNEFFFNQFLKISSGPFEIGDIRLGISLALAVVWILNWVIVFFGVQKGVERANKIFMPLLFVLVSILVIWSVNLKGASLGLAVYLKPNFALLSKSKIWIDAFSQIFFTLSLAFGIMATYASYLPKKTDIVKDAWIVAIGNSAFSIFAGFAVFGTLGYMAQTTGQPISEVVKESIGLAFVAYPKAISLMPAFASLFGVLFFTSLVIAGLSSGVSLVEGLSSAVMDKFHYSRRVVVSVVCLTGFLGSIIFTAKSGLYWVDIVDHFVTHYGLVIIGVLECVLIAWFFKARKLHAHINQSLPTSEEKNIKHIRKNINEYLTQPLVILDYIIHVLTRNTFEFCIKYVTPCILIILLINDMIAEVSAPYEGYPWMAIVLIGCDWLIAALIISFFVALRSWKTELNKAGQHHK